MNRPRNLGVPTARLRTLIRTLRDNPAALDQLAGLLEDIAPDLAMFVPPPPANRPPDAKKAPE